MCIVRQRSFYYFCRYKEGFFNCFWSWGLWEYEDSTWTWGMKLWIKCLSTKTPIVVFLPLFTNVVIGYNILLHCSTRFLTWIMYLTCRRRSWRWRQRWLVMKMTCLMFTCRQLGTHIIRMGPALFCSFIQHVECWTLICASVQQECSIALALIYHFWTMSCICLIVERRPNC